MKIFNVRLGHATNSSSTHSIVLNPSLDTDWNADRQDYGWENFLLRSREKKEHYLATQIMCNLQNLGMSNRYSTMIANGVVGKDIINYDDDGYNWGVDHQSVIALPMQHPAKNGIWSRGKGELDLDFAKEFFQYIYENDNIGIAGGNDNEYSHEKINYGGEIDKVTRRLHRDGSSKHFICRQDGEYWTIFNTYNGTKIRLSFKTNKPYEKAYAPELVDIKITDFCPYGCKFCLDPNTLVLTSDLQWKPIYILQEGDELIGFDEYPEIGTKTRTIKRSKIKAKWTTNKQAMRVTTTEGSVVCSLDHRWLMSHTHRWLEAKNLKIGHSIMFTVNPWQETYESERYMKGYLSGISCGDGTSRWEPKPDWKPGDPGQVYWRIAIKDKVALDRADKYLKSLGFETHGVKPMPDTNNMHRLEIRSREMLLKLRPIIEVEQKATDHDYMCGWLAGFFDAEGSYNGVVRFSQTSTNLFLILTETWLRNLGFDSTHVPGVEVRLLGGKWQAVKLFGEIKPAISRKMEYLFSGMKCKPAMVTKLELLPEQELVDIETETGTFIANGMASHNCYQSSTMKGAHAGKDVIDGIIRTLGEMQVFEVALGGGETTMHPDFPSILGTCRTYGLIPNFTTFNMDWAKNPAIERAVLDNCGGFAVSVTAGDYNEGQKVRDLKDWLDHHRDWQGRVAVQTILGLCDTSAVISMIKHMKDSNIRQLTLLGYKSFGRGMNFSNKTKIQKVDLKKVMKVVKDSYISLGMDTRAIQNYQDVLDEEGINEVLRTTKEGMFSMYIDAVNQKVARDSYTDDMHPFTTEHGGKDKLENVIMARFPFDTTETVVYDPYHRYDDYTLGND